MNDLYSRITSLTEREKELKCLYNVDMCLSGEDIFKALRNIATALPAGWQFPDICSVEINCFDIRVKSPCFESSSNKMTAEIKAEGNNIGNISVYYPLIVRNVKPGFLPEEQLLLNAVARRISAFVASPVGSSERSVKTEDTNWEWRMNMVKEICNFTDFNGLQIISVYVAGSTKNATAGPASDIDLIVVHNSNDPVLIKEYFKGWSHCLSVWNNKRTGILSKEGLIDLHLVHENEINTGNSWTTMLASTENSAKLIKSVK